MRIALAWAVYGIGSALFFGYIWMWKSRRPRFDTMDPLFVAAVLCWLGALALFL